MSTERRHYNGIEQASLGTTEAMARTFLATSLWDRVTFGDGRAAPPGPVPGAWDLLKRLWALYGDFRRAFGGAKAKELLATLLAVLIEAGMLLLERWTREARPR